MKRILIALVLMVLFIQPLWAITSIEELRDQVKMTLAQGEPQITDAIIDDFLILAIQNVSANGLACEMYGSVSCSSETKSYAFSPIESEGGSGLFIKTLNKDCGTVAYRSIWEISPKDLGRKWLINPPPRQYYYIWHKADTSYFSLFDPATSTATLKIHVYYVPTYFGESKGRVFVPNYYDDVIIELTLFFCYVRLKDWGSAFMAYNKYSKSLSVVRELHINRQPNVTFGPQEIKE